MIDKKFRKQHMIESSEPERSRSRRIASGINKLQLLFFSYEYEYGEKLIAF